MTGIDGGGCDGDSVGGGCDSGSDKQTSYLARPNYLINLFFSRFCDKENKDNIECRPPSLSI